MTPSDIHIITTGGTIESITEGASVSLDATDRLGDSLLSHARSLGARISTSSPMKKLSENMTPVDWLTLATAIETAYEDGYRRIVVTHGTDTMAFSVSAVAVLRTLYRDATICFTGSYLPPDDKGSDWNVNLSASIACVMDERIKPGVYVAFRADASNKSARIISSGHLKPMMFDSLMFEAAFDHYAGHWQGGAITNIAPEHMTHGPKLARADLAAMKDVITASAGNVCMLETHPGMDFAKVGRFIAEHRVAVFDLYHSGTGPSYSSENGLAEFLTNNFAGVRCLFCVYPSAYINVPYDSTLEIVSKGGLVIKDLQPHQVYTYMVLGAAAGLEVETLLSHIPMLKAA
jgi:L-asparaginase/Glu-tRNA(Gln) amidotransferase subunit D